MNVFFEACVAQSPNQTEEGEMLPLMGSALRVGSWDFHALQMTTYVDCCTKNIIFFGVMKVSLPEAAAQDFPFDMIINRFNLHLHSKHNMGTSTFVQVSWSPTAQLSHHALFLKVPDIHSCRLWLSFVQRDFGKKLSFDRCYFLYC